jgi:hypothetical protein
MMVATGLLNPVIRAGQEIWIELGLILGASPLGELRQRLHKSDPPELPELRIDDEQIVAQRKVEAFLQTVRHGAVRR